MKADLIFWALLSPLLLLLSPPAMAQAVVFVRASGAEPQAYQAFIESRPGTMAYSDWSIRSRVSHAAEEEVKQRLLVAQNEFLKGELANARQKFQTLNELALTQDWRSGERQTFAYAEMRLAQLALDEDSRMDFLLQASRWGAVGLQENLFPAPLWSEYQRRLLQRRITTANFGTKFGDARYLLVDGKPVALTESATFEVDTLEHRFTLVFDHRRPVTRTATWETLNSWSLNDEALLKGSCDGPIWLDPQAKPNVGGFFTVECQVISSKSEKVALSDVKPQLGLSHSFTQLSPQKNEAQPFFKSGWFWGATGVVAIVVFALASQKQDSGTTPTTSVGF